MLVVQHGTREIRCLGDVRERNCRVALRTRLRQPPVRSDRKASPGPSDRGDPGGTVSYTCNPHLDTHAIRTASERVVSTTRRETVGKLALLLYAMQLPWGRIDLFMAMKGYTRGQH